MSSASERADGPSVFVVWDFETQDIKLTLELFASNPQPASRATVPGLEDRAGEIWWEIVEPDLRAADRVIAFVEEPNANVGFEIGYALGLGKHVRLAWGGKTLPPWLQRPPLVNNLLAHVKDIDDLRGLVGSDQRVPVPKAPVRGPRTLVLCPTEGQGKAMREWLTKHRGDWLLSDSSSWTLRELPERLKDVGRVVWITMPFHSQSSRRHGEENAALSVIAGFALAHGLEVPVWRHDQAPTVVDIKGRAKPWSRLADLARRVDELDAPPLDQGDVLDRYLAYLRREHVRLVPLFPHASEKTLAEVYVDLELELTPPARHAADRAAFEELRVAEPTLRGLMSAPRRADAKRARRWAVLGEPGSGKSTLCRHLCHVIAQEDGAAIPVFISLARLAREQRHPFDLAQQDMTRREREVAAKGLSDRLHALAKDTDRVWLLLDALDEVAPDRLGEVRATIASLAESLPRSTIAVTSRPTGYTDLGSGFERARVRPLSGRARRDLLERWIGADKAGALCQQLPLLPNLDALAGNPLMLTLIAGLARDGKALPSTALQLYERSIDLLLRHGYGEDRKPVRAPDTAALILPRLALALHETKRESWARLHLVKLAWELNKTDEDLRQWFGAWGSPEACLDDVAQQSGILGPLDGSEEPWRFLHRALRDYLAAKRLAEQGEGVYIARVKKLGGDGQAIGYWGNAYALLCGLVDPERRIPTLTKLREASPELALRALPSIEDVAPEEILEFLIGTGGWDGEDLRRLVLGWRSVGVEAHEIRDLVMRRVAADASTESLAFLLYGLERGGVDVDPEPFFRACARWPDGGPPPIETCVIDAGSFVMGSAEGEGYDRERPRHAVELTAFRIGKFTVTEEGFALFDRGGKPSKAKCRLPVVGVNWWEAWLFCRWVGGDLPTEAQWEYACRAGARTRTRFWSGDQDDDLARVGWYADNSEGRLHPVGEKPANPWGLHDVHGNVWEWCADWFGDYEGHGRHDPPGPESGSDRVLRGGGFGFVGDGCRSACRFRNPPDVRWNDVGFRVALPAAPSSG